MSPAGKTKKTVAVIGYGSQGRAVALNLRDSGYKVVVGLRSRSASRAVAAKDRPGDVATIPEAVKKADVVCFAIPDHRHVQVYERNVAPNVRHGVTLL
ncbi:MAG: NAD(P)-binding domain-containing protein, partial [candidate division Zixibacteria bacterium]|nr:NAD(P)-binding domain-containing protein [candidate division Zixibacteria bacterium]